MEIENCLIASAGVGSRMGKIGKEIPKVLWPFFEKSLLEIQIEFVRSLGIKNIYVNIWHQKEKFEFFQKKQKDESIFFIEEDQLLGSGGAIHNLILNGPLKKKGALLYLAGDQFYFFEKSLYDKAKKEIKSFNSVLFSLKVKMGDKYNLLSTTNGILKGIRKFHDIPNNEYEGGHTFSGMGLINLEKLDLISGKSSFFETVANFKKDPVKVLNPKTPDYWDFGTLENYFQNNFKFLRKVIENRKGPFLDFCLESKIIDLNKVSDQDESYGVNGQKKVINLTHQNMENWDLPKTKGLLFLPHSGSSKIDLPTDASQGIIWGQIFAQL